MAFAGLWASRRDPGTSDWERTCTIITTGSEGVIGAIRDRMPVGLDPEAWDRWLDRDLTDPEEAKALLRTIDPEEVMEHRVSRDVNSVKNNGPVLRARVDPDTLF
jgi:putative SOS response-associated peptidase YedK